MIQTTFGCAFSLLMIRLFVRLGPFSQSHLHFDVGRSVFDVFYYVLTSSAVRLFGPVGNLLFNQSACLQTPAKARESRIGHIDLRHATFKSLQACSMFRKFLKPLQNQNRLVIAFNILSLNIIMYTLPQLRLISFYSFKIFQSLMFSLFSFPCFFVPQSTGRRYRARL